MATSRTAVTYRREEAYTYTCGQHIKCMMLLCILLVQQHLACRLFRGITENPSNLQLHVLWARQVYVWQLTWTQMVASALCLTTCMWTQLSMMGACLLAALLVRWKNSNMGRHCFCMHETCADTRAYHVYTHTANKQLLLCQACCLKCIFGFVAALWWCVLI